MYNNIGKSNWLEDKEKLSGTVVTVEELDELWQDGVQEIMELEKLAKLENNYLMQKMLARMHIHLWELRDAGWKAITDAKGNGNMKEFRTIEKFE